MQLQLTFLASQSSSSLLITKVWKLQMISLETTHLRFVEVQLYLNR